MQTTLAEMGVNVKINEEPVNDLVQVTADDFDAVDHLSIPNRKSRKNKISKEETDELSK